MQKAAVLGAALCEISSWVAISQYVYTKLLLYLGLCGAAWQHVHCMCVWALSCSAAESTDRATALGCEVGSTSFVKALQQLGYSCGQSVMAADLAAFVTHKQLLGGAVSVEAGLQHCRQSSPGLLGETWQPVLGKGEHISGG
jgi:hypothetical protein